MRGATTKIGIISDLHADLGALTAALDRMRQLGCERIVCAGDVVDGDVFPDEVIAMLAEEGIPTIRGNHDRWALDHAQGRGPSQMYGSGFELSAASISFLSGLPTSYRFEIDGIRVVTWHASPGSDMEPIAEGSEAAALASAGADVLLVGHTHEPRATWTTAGLVANPGALYRKSSSFEVSGALYVARGKSTGGTFGVLELPSGRFTVHRVTDGATVVDVERPR